MELKINTQKYKAPVPPCPAIAMTQQDVKHGERP